MDKNLFLTPVCFPLKSNPFLSYGVDWMQFQQPQSPNRWGRKNPLRNMKSPFQIANHPSFDFTDTAVDLCKQPNVVNGDVTAVTDSSNIFVGSVTCNEGYILVGKTRIKCVNGIWSSSTPVCTRKKILFWLLISLGTFTYFFYFQAWEAVKFEICPLSKMPDELWWDLTEDLL